MVGGRVEDEPPPAAEDVQAPDPVARDGQDSGEGRRQRRRRVGEAGQGPLGLIEVARVVSRCGPPFEPDEQALDRSALARDAAEVEARRPRSRGVSLLAVDLQDHPVGVGGPDRPEELVAADQADLVLGGVDLEAAGRLGQPDQAQVVEMSGQARGRHGLPDRIARQPDLDERPARALAVGQLVAVDGDLGPLGAEPDAQAMPSLAPGQLLHGEGGPPGRLDRQALLGPAEDHADRSRGPSGPRNVRSTTRC